MSDNPTPASETERECNVMEYDGAFKCYTHNVMWGAVSKPDEPVCAGAYRALQAENERLNKLVAAQHGAMRSEWKDLIAERDRYKAEAEQWQQAAGEQMVRAEGLEDVLDHPRISSHIRENERLEKANKTLCDALDAAEKAIRKSLSLSIWNSDPEWQLVNMRGLLRDVLKEHFTNE